MLKNRINHMIRSDTRHLLTALFSAGIASVKGDIAVSTAFSERPTPAPTKILAVGKAAYSMYQGVPCDIRDFTPALVVTKDGHAENAPNLSILEILETSHPVPCERSLHAGQKVLQWVENCNKTDRLLLLVSGGASSLVEVLQPNLSLGDIVASTTAKLSDGSPIVSINQQRIGMSLIKGGKLLAGFKGDTVEVMVISDVPSDDIMIIGSGIGACLNSGVNYSCKMIGTNKVARQAVLRSAAKKTNIPICCNEETLYGDIDHVSHHILNTMSAGKDGLYIFGGEPTVRLPENPGNGGRNQGLALLLAQLIATKPGYSFIVGGTDGSDGVSDAAGAFVDHESFHLNDSGLAAIENANSAQFFHLTGDQIVTGPTGTNVMDLVIGLKNTSNWKN